MAEQEQTSLFDELNGTPEAKAMRAKQAKDKKTPKKTAKKDKSVVVKANFTGDNSWMNNFKLDGQGNVKTRSIFNIQMILDHDALTKGLIAYDSFADQITKTRDVKPLKIMAGFWSDADSAIVRAYIERNYSLLFGRGDIADAVVNVAKGHEYNPVKQAIEKVKWDGKPRAETYFIDYLGAENNDYTKAVTRAWLSGAVSRIYHPGCKFEMVPVLEGAQGIGKSTTVRNLYPDAFSDSLKSLGKSDEDYKKLQGAWVIELGELSALNKTEIELVKNFISAQQDTYRESYGHFAAPHLRKCVFIGTTNHQDYLKDSTGERRFFPIRCGVITASKDPLHPDPNDIAQILAEVKTWVDAGEPLFLDAAMMAEAHKYQQEAETVDPMKEAIEDYLNMEVPTNWASLTASVKRGYYRSQIEDNGDIAGWIDAKIPSSDRVPMDWTTAREILAVVFDKPVDKYLTGRTGTEAKKIKLLLDNAKGWKPTRRRINGGNPERGYSRE